MSIAGGNDCCNPGPVPLLRVRISAKDGRKVKMFALDLLFVLAPGGIACSY